MDINPANTTKQRALRIPLAYPNTRDRLLRRKWLWAALAGLIASAYGAFVAVDWSARAPIDGVTLHASHGPLSVKHALWDAQCSACHVEQSWSPMQRDAIRSDAWAAQPPPTAAESKWSRGIDAKCRACHMGGNEAQH